MEIFTFENLIALLTLTSLEIVLGIDNIIFISVLVGKLEQHRRERARRVGLLLAMGTRILLLVCIKGILMLTTPIMTILSHPVSGRDIVMLFGGLFLIGKATFEIHDKIEGPTEKQKQRAKSAKSYYAALVQIALIDIVFSLDSVITAVGMAEDIWVMVAAIVIAVGVMMFFARAVSNFIEENPTFKMLALSFLLLVGVMLFVEGFGKHVDKGYIYFAIGFSLFVEMLNTRIRKIEKMIVES